MFSGARVQAVRRFNRYYTKVLGVLAEGLNQTPYTLTETRVLFELNQRDSTEVTALRKDLDLDAGYLSRLLAKFETEGLVSRGKSASDGRRQLVSLTETGRQTMAMLDERSDEEIGSLLAPLSESDQRAVVQAMAVIHDKLGIRYMNCGDWVESCTALAETYEGEFELIRWTSTAAQSPARGSAPQREPAMA